MTKSVPKGTVLLDEAKSSGLFDSPSGSHGGASSVFFLKINNWRCFVWCVCGGGNTELEMEMIDI